MNLPKVQHNLVSPIRLVMGGMLALVVAMGIGRFVYTPILPMMVDELGLSASQAGMIASSNFLGYLIGALLASTSLVKGSQRTWMLVALMASALTTLLMSLADSYMQFLLLRFLGGLVSAWVLVFTTTIVIEHLTVIKRSQLSAVLFAGVGIGIVCASVLTTLGANIGNSWRSAWLFSGMFSALTVFAVIYLVPAETLKPEVKNTASSIDYRSIRTLIAAYGLFGFGYVITATFISQLVRSADYSQSVETWIWVLVGLSAAPSVWFWNTLAQRLGNNTAFAMACVCEAFAVAASVLVENLFGFLFSAIFLGGTFMGITALGLVEARVRSSGNSRHTLALMTTAFGLGQIVGPFVAGSMRDVSGSFMWPTLMACVALLFAALLVFRDYSTAQ